MLAVYVQVAMKKHFFFVYCEAIVDGYVVLWYTEKTVKAEFDFWSMLFEEKQHFGDCIVNERSRNTSRDPLVF